MNDIENYEIEGGWEIDTDGTQTTYYKEIVDSDLFCDVSITHDTETGTADLHCAAEVWVTDDVRTSTDVHTCKMKALDQLIDKLEALTKLVRDAIQHEQDAHAEA